MESIRLSGSLMVVGKLLKGYPLLMSRVSLSAPLYSLVEEYHSLKVEARVQFPVERRNAGVV